MGSGTGARVLHPPPIPASLGMCRLATRCANTGSEFVLDLKACLLLKTQVWHRSRLSPRPWGGGEPALGCNVGAGFTLRPGRAWLEPGRPDSPGTRAPCPAAPADGEGWGGSSGQMGMADKNT